MFIYSWSKPTKG